MSLPGKRNKATTPSAGVESGLSKSSSLGQKKLRGEGDGQIPHNAGKETHKKKQGTFTTC